MYKLVVCRNSKQHLMYRQWISSWTQSKTKKNTLVNEKRWNEIRESFLRKAKKRLEGTNTHGPDKDDDVSLDYMNTAEEKRPVLIALCT